MSEAILVILVWAFLVWLRPFLRWFAAFSAGETQIWPGDSRVGAVVWFLFVFFSPWICLVFWSQSVSYVHYFTALSLSGPSLRARSAATEETKILQILYGESVLWWLAFSLCLVALAIFFCFDRRPVPFGGSRCETYSSPRHDRGPVPGANRSAASCLCMVLKRALYHCSARSPAWLLSPTNLNAIFTWLPIACNVLLVFVLVCCCLPVLFLVVLLCFLFGFLSRFFAWLGLCTGSLAPLLRPINKWGIKLPELKWTCMPIERVDRPDESQEATGEKKIVWCCVLVGSLVVFFYV